MENNKEEEDIKLPFEITTKDEPRKNIVYYIDIILMIIVVGLVIYMWYNGHYQEREIIEVCNGISIK
jgi:hypothetical protein